MLEVLRQLLYFGVGGLVGPTNPPAALWDPKEHEARLARNTMSNHTDMQDKYCGHCYDIYPRQSQYTQVANRVNVGAVTAILVLHVGVIGDHVP